MYQMKNKTTTTINVNVLFIIYSYVVFSFNMWQESRYKEIRSLYSPISPRSDFSSLFIFKNPEQISSVLEK